MDIHVLNQGLIINNAFLTYEAIKIITRMQKRRAPYNEADAKELYYEVLIMKDKAN